jgi:hypothetical protein
MDLSYDAIIWGDATSHRSPGTHNLHLIENGDHNLIGVIKCLVVTQRRLTLPSGTRRGSGSHSRLVEHTPKRHARLWYLEDTFSAKTLDLLTLSMILIDLLVYFRTKTYIRSYLSPHTRPRGLSGPCTPVASYFFVWNPCSIPRSL